MVSFAARPVYHVGYVAYFQLNIDYIIETYCINKDEPKLQCNGKCHLTKQLATATTDTKSNIAVYNLAEAFFPVFYSEYNYNKISKVVFTTKTKTPLKSNQLYTYMFDYSHFKPPIV